MTVTYQPLREIAADQWLLEWSSDQSSPTYLVWVNGEIVSIQTDASITIDSTTEPVVEVDDSGGDTIEQQDNPGRAVVQWFGLSAASYYLVQQYVDAAWTTIDTVFEDGRGYYSSTSGWLADVTTHQFRVVPYDSGDNAGTAVTFTVDIVRNPDVPAVGYSYSSGTGDVTVSAA